MKLFRNILFGCVAFVLVLLVGLRIAALLLTPWPEMAPGINMEVQRSYCEPGTLRPDNAFWYLSQLTNRIEIPREARKTFNQEGMRSNSIPALDAALIAYQPEINTYLLASTQTTAVAEACFNLTCPYPYISTSLELSRLISYRAERSAYIGDWDSALRDWKAIIDNGVHFQNGPNLIMSLVRNGIVSLGVRSMHRAAELSPPPSHITDRIIALHTETLAKISPFAETVRAERKGLQNTLDSLIAKDMGILQLLSWEMDKSSRWDVIFYTVGKLFGSNPAASKQHIDCIISQILLAVEKSNSNKEAIDKINSLLRVPRPLRWLSFANDPLARLSVDLLIPTYGKVYQKDVEMRQIIEMERLHYDVLRYYCEKGSIPEDLSVVADYAQVTPPSDRFFDGHLIRYKRKDHGWIIYSVGIDGIDHGGAAEEDEFSGNQLDLVSRFQLDRAVTP